MTAALRVAWLVVFALLGACKGTESLGANCLSPNQACAGKSCGAECTACSTAAATAPDVVGHCSADGICTVAAASCGPVSTGGQQGTGGQGGAAGSAGCGKPATATGQLAGQTITVAGQARTYALTVPTNYQGDTPLALVFAWHGANVDGATARRFFNIESKSAGTAIFVYPDGTAAIGWDTSPGSADLQVFSTLLSYLSSSYCIDPTRVFSTGHSTGAIMTNDLGCYYGDRLRAIAPVEGTPASLAGRTSCTGSVAALIVHGQNDQVLPIAQGQASRDFWLSQNGCGSQTATWAPEPACVAYQGCQSDLPVVWCVHDEAHAWPNLTSDCNGGICFDAGSAIWAFFSSFH